MVGRYSRRRRHLLAASVLALVVSRARAATPRPLSAIIDWHEAPRPIPRDATFMDGQRARALGDYTGQVLVVNFWATWCAPCILEMPALVELQRHVGLGFRVLTISIDASEAAVTRFFASYKLGPLPRYRDPQRKLFDYAGAKSLPTSLILDASGREIGRVRGAAAWNRPEMVQYMRTLVREARSHPSRPLSSGQPGVIDP